MPVQVHTKLEWLEADGLGGFASGTVSGMRTRRYHALLLAATTPPTGRIVLVNGFDAWVDTPDSTFALSSQFYTGDVLHPDGAGRIEAFESEPWPRWRFRLEDGTPIEQALFVPRGAPVVALSWRLGSQRVGVHLTVRPFLSGRDYHTLHHENPAFRFESVVDDDRVLWRPYAELPEILALSNGAYTSQPEWYRNFLYEEERARGLDCTEDLAAPGTFRWDLVPESEAILILAVVGQASSLPSATAGWKPAPQDAAALLADVSAAGGLRKLRAAERLRRRLFPSRLHRAADAYVVRRGEGKTIVAGYPWFTDWGRDTFIALRGLCLATGKVDAAREVLLTWAGTVSEGMLPNRFPDHGQAPEFNSVDASLWFVIAVYEFFRALEGTKRKVTRRDQKTLWEAVDAILDGYTRGTRYGIRLDEGLLAAGEPGVQLTWMDVQVDGQVLSPRVGKPVEVEALWLNALWVRSGAVQHWADLFARGCESFRARFWNEAGGCLYDVVDCDHQAGRMDATFRPNQIFAVGGLPFALLEGERARRVVEAVEARLWTPRGLRSLAPGEPGYAPRYEGGVRERDRAYHEGTVWPWLMGPFVEAWVRVRGETPESKREARARFLEPLLRQVDEAGLGHLCEIADGDSPHTPRGCPFQAWSLGEALRLALVVLKEGAENQGGGSALKSGG
ncbi:MAG: glycogen debranching enzyme family protein [Planctomycetes bacterium]|nr:glycogen debranching enzyme family protein [Planctomycetota bacterium]